MPRAIRRDSRWSFDVLIFFRRRGSRSEGNRFFQGSGYLSMVTATSFCPQKNEGRLPLSIRSFASSIILEDAIESPMKDTKGMKFNALCKIRSVHLVHPMGEGKSAWSDRLLDKSFLHGKNWHFQAFQMRDLVSYCFNGQLPTLLKVLNK